MAKVPGQRKAGQTGGGGRINHTGSRGLSGSRGGNPYKGGAGGGKTPRKGSGGGSKSMVIVAFVLLAVPATGILGLVAYFAHAYGVL